MASLNYSNEVSKYSKRLKSLESMGGKGLLQPFNNTNSGSRKLMHSVHRDHCLPLIHGKKAIVETGYESRYGDFSSSVIESESDSYVIAKISKFSFAPHHHYWLIVRNNTTNKLEVLERIAYHHITESYGYLLNNEYLDGLNPGSSIKKGDIVQKSLSFDDYGNRTDGVNLNIAYMALDANMEDSVIFSDEAASKMTSALIKPVTVMINENDIPLNIYGDNNVYKSIPDIGEQIQHGILLALRKEKKEEAPFMQSVDRLQNVMMSDEKITLHGRVVDVDIYCNNPADLDKYSNSQFKMYYDELQRCSLELVSTITPLLANGAEMDYKLQKLYANAKRVLNKDQYIDKRLFSNLQVKITVLEELPLSIGDKTSNRFGGKGIVSNIIPKDLMPKFNDNNHVDVILNSSTMYNRENPGQLFELSLTHCGDEIIKAIQTGEYSIKESYDMIIDYLKIVSPYQAEELENWIDDMSEQDLQFFIESIIQDGSIHISLKPMSESMDIDRLNMLYKRFPFIKQNEISVPIMDSNGNIRYIKSRRPIVIGKQYMFRLKQFAEEKFSATSLSATNIRNENTKSKANREYRELYSQTPIRAGSMEIDNMNHIGAEYVVSNLLLHSLSPQGRRLVEQFYTGDPFTVDIKLDKDSKNRSAEILNTYLKTIGLRIRFIKTLKKKPKTISISPISFTDGATKKVPFRFVYDKDFDFQKDFELKELENKRKALKIYPIRFMDKSPM